MDNRPICYKIGHGAIIIYGEKIEYYTNYLDNNSSSAESLCIYCKIMDYICSIFLKKIYLDLLIIVISKNLRKNTSSKGLLKIYTSNLKQCSEIAYYY